MSQSSPFKFSPHSVSSLNDNTDPFDLNEAHTKLLIEELRLRIHRLQARGNLLPDEVKVYIENLNHLQECFAKNSPKKAINFLSHINLMQIATFDENQKNHL